MAVSYKFESPFHLFNTVKKMLREKEIEITHEEYLAELCDIYFNFINSETIELKFMKLGLREPTSVLTWKVVSSNYQDVPGLLAELDKTLVQYYEVIESGDMEYFKNKYPEIFMRKTFFDPQLEAMNKLEGKEVNEEFLQEMEEVKFKAGVYFLYDNNHKLIYIGKSRDLGSRIPSSVRDRRASKYSYGLTNSFSDAGIYEMYYISKFKPSLNVDGKFPDYPTVELPDLELKPIREVFQKEEARA